MKHTLCLHGATGLERYGLGFVVLFSTKIYNVLDSFMMYLPTYLSIKCAKKIYNHL